MMGSIGASVLFGTNGTFKAILGADDQHPFSTNFILAAILTGAVEGTIYTPFEHVKLRMQLATDAPSMSQVVTRITRTIGVQGLYRGYGATSIREMSGNGAFFSSYAITKYGMCRLRGKDLSEGETAFWNNICTASLIDVMRE